MAAQKRQEGSRQGGITSQSSRRIKQIDVIISACALVNSLHPSQLTQWFPWVTGARPITQLLTLLAVNQWDRQTARGLTFRTRNRLVGRPLSALERLGYIEVGTQLRLTKLLVHVTDTVYSITPKGLKTLRAVFSSLGLE